MKYCGSCDQAIVQIGNKWFIEHTDHEITLLNARKKAEKSRAYPSPDECEFESEVEMVVPIPVEIENEDLLEVEAIDEETFSTIEVLENEEDAEQSDSKTSVVTHYECLACGKTLKHLKTMERHFLSQHPGENASKDQYIVEVREEIAEKHALHAKRKKLPEKPTDYDYMCLSDEDLDDAGQSDFIQLKTGNSFYECSVCESDPNVLVDMRMHMIRNHPEVADYKALTKRVNALHSAKRFECSVCQQRGCQIENVRKHVKQKHPDVEEHEAQVKEVEGAVDTKNVEKRYVCLVCQRSSVNVQRMYEHIITKHPDQTKFVAKK